jgi:isoquinoline 1-oxidoreductase beta subunit
MSTFKTKTSRREFIRNVSLGSGGIILSFNWLASCNSTERELMALPNNWYELNGYLKIGENGLATIMSPNPEIGQNVKTSMPMLVAEELDIDWKNVLVEQAPLNVGLFGNWQIAGGSRSIGSSWVPLRQAGATARKMLLMAAASSWSVPVDELTTSNGIITHKASGKSGHYGVFAEQASKLEVPEEVELKKLADYKIIGHSKKNVDGKNIVTGKPLFGLDTYKEGMLTAMIVHPPAFGKVLKSFDASSVINMPGIKDVFTINTFNDEDARGWSDITAFNEQVVIVGESTWQVMKAKKALKVEWQNMPKTTIKQAGWGGNATDVAVPTGLENTVDHNNKLNDYSGLPLQTARKDGNPEKAFKEAAKVLERTYTAPFRAHNTMEPMNFFADVTEDRAILSGPVQTPEAAEGSVATRLKMPREKIEVHLSRMGGGFGRRLYGTFVVEAALISQQVKAPIKLVYTREDDMTYGTYRPAYTLKYRAAIDKDNNLTAIHVIGGGIPESPLHENRFPAGALDHYLAEKWVIPSNITIGAYRAPRSNFNASAEQSFLDELAETLGKDPLEFRLELLKRAQDNPVGERNDYDAKRYAGVLELVKKNANWGAEDKKDLKRGVAAYYCHQSYVANVVDVRMDGSKPVIDEVFAAVDCGIVVNPDAATNLAEGGTVDGIGTAMYGELSFVDGMPQQDNFDKYRQIRHHEAPKKVSVDFVKSDIAPTGMGEPPYPPVQAALANAIYSASGKRLYHQPFINELNS